jgi:hypothetical protein
MPSMGLGHVYIFIQLARDLYLHVRVELCTWL